MSIAIVVSQKIVEERPMTGPYEWNPMPRVLAVTCPSCQSEAAFEFCTLHQVAKKDLSAFERLKHFDLVKTRERSGYRYLAVFYPGLHGDLPGALRDLPDGYAPQDWAQPQYAYMNNGFEQGSIVCGACGSRRKHVLRWPHDAFFQVEHKDHVLWAFNRDTAVDLLRFVQADNRDFRRFTYRHFLMKVPSVFLSKKARPAVAKKLLRLLKPVS